MENALASGVWIFISGIAAIVLLLIGKWCLRKMRESKLPAKQRLMLEYGRMTGYLRKRHEDFDCFIYDTPFLVYHSTVTWN